MGIVKSYKTLYDPQMGVKLLTLKEAATYLDYHPFSVYKLVSQGALKPHKVGGKTLVFMQDELDQYKLSNKWAARKAAIPRQRHVAGEELPSTMTATMMIDLGLGLEFGKKENIADFTWDHIPLIRADLDNRYGKKMRGLEITINSPDGWRWHIRLDPPTFIEKVKDKLGRFSMKKREKEGR